MQRKKRNKGFTLIELIVVIAILGILAAIVIPKLGGFQDSAKVGAIEANHKLIVNALNMAYTEDNAWPTASNWVTKVETYLNDTITNMQNDTGATHTWTVDATGKGTLTTTASGNSKFTAKYPSGLTYTTN